MSRVRFVRSFRRRLRPISYLTLGLCVAMTTASAQDRSSWGDGEEPFTLGDRTWESKQAFIESGARCATRSVSSAEAEAIQRRLEQFAAARRRAGGEASVQRTPGTVTVPVYFHVIRRGLAEADGNVPEQRLDAQIEVLNNTYAGRIGGADTAFRFVKAGVTRTTNATWFAMPYAEDGSPVEIEAKRALHVVGANVLNLYTVQPGGGLLGWATFPWEYQANWVRDGVVVHHATLPGGTLDPYDLGYTGTHEVGHWLGLFHTFQGWPEEPCSATNDFVPDTPAEARPAYGCVRYRDSCPAPGVDSTDNFMNYTDDACMDRFTPGQASRMDLMHALLRDVRPDDIALTGARGWKTLPLAISRANGTFTVLNPFVGDFGAWSATAGAVKLAGDFNGDGWTDLALAGPSSWTTVPVAFSNGNGGFNVTNLGGTGNWSLANYAATPGAVKLAGDFNGDGRTDVALTGPSNWTTVPVAFSNGRGSFSVVTVLGSNFASWAATPGAVKLTGDFNGDGRTDLALTGPSSWNTVPVAFSRGDGSFRVTNIPNSNFAGWAATPGAVVLTGDFNGDGWTDLALTGPSGWNTLPVAFSNGDGSFTVTNRYVGWFASRAATPGAVKLAGDFNGDGRMDIALTGASGWTTLPVAFSNGDGSFGLTNTSVPDFAGWAATPGAVKIVGNFDFDTRADIVLTGPPAWTTLPVAFSMGTGAFRVVNSPAGSFASWSAAAPVKLKGDFR